MELVETGSIPQLRFLARAWNIYKSAFQRRVKSTGDSKHTIGRKPLISQEDENVLVELVTTLGKRGFPLRREDIQNFTFQFAQKKQTRASLQPRKKLSMPDFRGS